MSWIQSYSGNPIDLMNFENNDFNIVDIAHSLAMQCRFMGHCKAFYSVAEHSVRVSDILPQRLKLWGLLHDAPEAFGMDIPKPLKVVFETFTGYKEYTQKMESSVYRKLGLGDIVPDEVKKADKILFATEFRDLMRESNAPWDERFYGVRDAKPLLEQIEPWLPSMAEKMFLDRYFTYTGIVKNLGS